MKKHIDAVLARVLARWVDAVRRRARAVSSTILVLTLGLAVFAALNLGINSDNLSLIADELPSKQAMQDFIARFPNLEEAIFVVVDAETPELARESAEQMVARMAAEPEYFSDVYLPGGGEFFERHGLLYRSPEDLDDFADEMARVQPLLAELEQDSSIAHMADVVQLGLRVLDPNDQELAKWPGVLDQVSKATVTVYHEYPYEVSWEELLLQGSSIDVTTRRAIVVHPVLDYADILVARRPIQRVRAIAHELGLSPDRGVTVRLTGNPALNYDEMVGFAWDIGGASVFCFLIVTWVLVRALRSLRLVIAALVTLFTGLIWTVAFAAASIGSLNLLTISFAIIYLGLGVDFGIHLGMGYADHLRRGETHANALRHAASHVGGSLFFCTLTTSIAFWVFVPSDFRGLAELGLIAGGSMFIIFFLTLTFFPALVSSWLRIDPARHLRAELRFSDGWWNRVAEHPRAVVGAAALAAFASAMLLPRVTLNANVVEMRDPDTESVQTMHDLLDDPNNTPWYLNVLTDDLESAKALAAEIDALDSVKWALTLDSYVPEDQEEKLEILSDIAFLLEPPPKRLNTPEPPSIAEQVEALRELRDFLASPPPVTRTRAVTSSVDPTPLELSILRLRGHLDRFLDRIEQDGDAERALAELERVLMASLPDQLRRLRTSLAPDEITLDTLPPRLVSRMLAEDGTARIQVIPEGDLRRTDEFDEFVGQVQAIAPDISGMIVSMAEFGKVTEESFYRAMIAAVVAISLLLLVLWRSPSDVLIVMAPLFLGASLTGATMVLLGVTFNFTNVIVIPLLFGIGVDSGIHLVQEERENPSGGRNLLGTPTARAVFYSSLTTIMSFGTMSLAGHRGLQSLGISLTIGLIYTVICVLFVLPVLIKIRRMISSDERAAGLKVPASG